MKIKNSDCDRILFVFDLAFSYSIILNIFSIFFFYSNYLIKNCYFLWIKHKCWSYYLWFIYSFHYYIQFLEYSKHLNVPECSSTSWFKTMNTHIKVKSTLTFTRSHDSAAIHLKFKCCWIIDRDIPEFSTNYPLLFPIGRTWGRTDSQGTVLISTPFKFIMRLLWHLSCIK